MKNPVRAVQAGSFLVFSALLVVNHLRGSQWVIDHTMALVVLIVLYWLNTRIKFSAAQLALFSGALLIHNIGSFAYYHWPLTLFGYDDLTHFVFSAVGAYLLYHYLHRCFQINTKERKVLAFLAVIAGVSLLGVAIEVTEYLGFRLLGEGEGLLFYGAGDADKFKDIAGQYIDTMNDVIVNTLGSLVGSAIFLARRS